jgi:hypothetical protein
MAVVGLGLLAAEETLEGPPEHAVRRRAPPASSISMDVEVERTLTTQEVGLAMSAILCQAAGAVVCPQAPFGRSA